LTPEHLVNAIKRLLNDRVGLSKMGEAARSLAHPNAARQMAAMAAKLAGESGR
jgi:UDP-N-acetylglucosamine:LPS N-acetylglucosamine transferase